MARATRIEYPGAWYHVMSRGVARMPTFLDDADRRSFLEMVGRLEAERTMTPEEMQKLGMIEEIGRRNAGGTATTDAGTRTEPSGVDSRLSGLPTSEGAVAGEGMDAWGTSGPAIPDGEGESTTLGAELSAVVSTILAGSGAGERVSGAETSASDGSASDGAAAERPTTEAPARVEPLAPGVFTAGNVGLVGFPEALARQLSGLGGSGR